MRNTSAAVHSVSSYQASGDGAGHVLTAAERRLDLSMAIRAFGYLHFSTILQFQGTVPEGCIALAASRVNTHPTHFALVCRHFFQSFNSNLMVFD